VFRTWCASRSIPITFLRQLLICHALCTWSCDSNCCADSPDLHSEARSLLTSRSIEEILDVHLHASEFGLATQIALQTVEISAAGLSVFRHRRHCWRDARHPFAQRIREERTHGCGGCRFVVKSLGLLKSL